MTLYERQIELARQEVESKRYDIIHEAEAIKKDALEIQEELAQVIRVAEQVIDRSDESIHFLVDPWKLSAWRRLTEEIVKLDGKIKARRELKLWVERLSDPEIAQEWEIK